jgi:hypothetical protein
MPRRRLTRAAAALGLAAVAVAGCSGSGSGTPGAQGTPRASHPSASPSYGGTLPLSVAIPRIEAFVQTERGLRFKHKVKVTLLSSKQFVAKLRASQGKDDAADAEKTRSTLAALGLIPASTDLAKAFHTALDAGVIGFYDDKSKQLYVRGTKASPGVQAVLSHELTHALTDQWFGLNRPGLNKDTQEKDLAFTTLIEGDAERTRMAYESKFSAADKAAAQKEESAGGTPKVPQIVLELISLPYAVGPTFVDAVVAHGGIKALDAAYRNPPISSEQVLDANAYFAHDVPKHVAVPRADGTPLDRSDLGQVGLFLMLAKRISQADAATAARGWGGDEYVSWKDGSGHYCLRDSIVMDGSDATTRLHTALAQWVHDSNGTARVESSGTTTTFRSCSS